MSKDHQLVADKFESIKSCRICGNENLVEVLNLGKQVLTGIFPECPAQTITSGPLRLVKCMGEEACGLLQLAETYDNHEMYGQNYGYRSGLNPSMVAHLQAKVAKIQSMISFEPTDLVIDIGSNDGTTLAAYTDKSLDLLGIDPAGEKFIEYYPAHVDLLSDYFSADTLAIKRPGRKARVVTSFSMFYDLENPLGFMGSVHDVLTDDGLWVFEQSYLPAMLAANSYDTVCHEHLEYYALKQIKWMTDLVGFKIVEIEFNQVNGGSFSIVAAKSGSRHPEHPDVDRILTHERTIGLDTLEPYLAFAGRVAKSRVDFLSFLSDARSQGKTISAIGASTKGNVLLQYCGLSDTTIDAIGEVNPEKFGKFTPGTLIPIVPEAEVIASLPDYLIVLPWHFREFFSSNPRFDACNLVFPLPYLDVRLAKTK